MTRPDVAPALPHDGVAEPLEHTRMASRPETPGSPDDIW